MLIAVLAMVLAPTFLTAQSSLLDSLENQLTQFSKQDVGRVDLLNNISYALRRVDLDRSCECGVEARTLAEKLDYQRGIAESFSNLGNCFYLRSDYKEAQESFQKAIDLNTKIENLSDLALSLNGIGMVHIQQGNYPLALDYVQKSLKIAEQINDKERISFANYNIANCHLNLGDYGTALEYYDLSLTISNELGRKDFISVNLRDMGQAHTQLKNYEEAQRFFERSLEIMEELDDQKGISFTLVTLGILHKKQNRLDQAFTYFKQAADLSKEHDFKHNLCNSYLCLGESYIERNDYESALNYALSGLLIAKELKIIPEQRDAFKQLSNIYETEGNYKNAYQSYKAFKALDDSIFSEESIRTIANLRSLHEYEKEKQKTVLTQLQKDAVQEAEARWQRTVRDFFIVAFIVTAVLVLIVFRISTQRKKANRILSNQKDEIEGTYKQLYWQNEEIQQQNEVLTSQRIKLESTLDKLQKAQSQLVQSEKMASVGVLTAGIAHEINNPLNFIHGGKSALDKYVKKNLKKHESKMKPLLDTIDMGIKRVTGIVLSINRFSRESGNKKERCEIGLILDNCLLMIQNQIKARIKVEKHYTEESFELLCQEGELHQVFLNVLMNAVQSIEGRGTIAIATELRGADLEVSVSDTGCGISPQNLDKVTNPFFTTKDPGKGTGLGMSISYNIIKGHKGKIQFESKEGEGTTVIVTLPVEKTAVEV